MNRIHHIRRHIAILAGLAFAWLGLAAPPRRLRPKRHDPGANWRRRQRRSGTRVQTVTRVVVVGGMPGWQIALIAAGAALFAAAVALLGYRILTTRRQAAAATA